MKIRGFILFAIISPVFAAPVVDIKGGRYRLIVDGTASTSYYSSDYKAKAAAVNKAFECNCVVEIEQPSLFVSVKYQSDDTAVITWKAPIERVNGESLSGEEIQGYELTIELDGIKTVVNVGNVTTYTAKGLAPGSYSFTLKTVDKSGLKSEQSLIVYKVI